MRHARLRSPSSRFGTPAASVLALLAACACSATPPAQVQAPTAAVSASEIDAAIGTARCSQDSECRSIGVGAMACGGPQAYRAWSIRTSNAQALADAVERHRAARQAQIQSRGEMSICVVIDDPGAHCARPAGAAEGRCELNSPRPAGGNTISR